MAGLVAHLEKTLPGDTATRDVKVREYAGQLGADADAVEAATGEPVRELWIHLAVRGVCVRVDLPRPGSCSWLRGRALTE